MGYKNIEQWKTAMRKIAKERNLDIQDVQQRYVLEEFAKKISISKYNESFILKGGFVVSTLLGLDTRMTKDLDMTYRSSIYNIEDMKKIVQEIMDTPQDSFFEYSLRSLKLAQEDDEYSGFIVVIQALREQANIKLKLDISNNTLIFPEALNSSFKSQFSSEHIDLMTYHVENIIAEKFETALDRGEYNTRMRDLFDIYLLMKGNSYIVDKNLLAQTIIEVSKDRDNLEEIDEIIDSLLSSPIFNKNFIHYKEIQYPNLNISIEDIFEQFKLIYQYIKKSDRDLK